MRVYAIGYPWHDICTYTGHLTESKARKERRAWTEIAPRAPAPTAGQTSEIGYIRLSPAHLARKQVSGVRMRMRLRLQHDASYAASCTGCRKGEYHKVPGGRNQQG